jgi:hypothetical protein
MPMTQRARVIATLTAICVGILLFVPFLSRQYDLNGIVEATAFDDGTLFSQNHLLFRPLAFAIKAVLHVLGLVPNTITLLQVFTAVCGAIGLGAIFWTISGLTQDWKPAALGAAWLATSFSYWHFSTDIAYIIPAAMFVAIALAFVTQRKSALFVGIFAGLAVLIWQANIFIVPMLAIGRFFIGTESRKEKAKTALVIIGMCGAVILVGYVLTASIVYNHTDPNSITKWALGYGGNRLPSWGDLGFDRLHTGLKSAFASIVPLNGRIGLGKLANPILPRPPRWRPAFLALMGLCLWPLVLIILRRKANWAQGKIALWLVIGYLSYAPFLIWWDPSETKWFCAPNLFFAALIAIAWHVAGWNRFGKAAAVIGVMAIAFCNFYYVILPRRTSESAAMHVARCVSDHMSAKDLFISEDWDWDGYLTYIHKRKVMSVIEESARYSQNKSVLWNALDKEIAKTEGSGGNVYLPDLNSYNSIYKQWLEQQTGWTKSDVDKMPSILAFSCSEMQIRRLTQK